MTILAASLAVSGCAPATATPVPPTPTPAPVAPSATPAAAPPTSTSSAGSAVETGWTDFAIPDFDAVHAPVPVGGDANRYLIFGKLPVVPPGKDVPPEVAALLGRWEGYDIPLWVIHGADDQAVPLSVAQSTVDALKKAGANVRFTVLEGHDHDVWTDTFTNPEFLDWFLQYQKP